MASESSSIESPPLIRISSESNFHFLEIDYSKSKHLLSIGKHISSPKFNAGGFDWVVHFYPWGRYRCRKSQGPSVAFDLHLVSEAKDVIAKYSLQVLAKTSKFPPIARDTVAIFGGHNKARGHEFTRKKIENFIRENGILVISASIKVLIEQKDPHGLCDHIEKLWEKGERFDVTFDVEGESISAHRFMLAARSPVFEAKLFGPMAEAKMQCIKIDEMKAEVFKALLEFVYTDRLPINVSSDDGTLSIELIQGLFVAADRYALEKLTLLCVEKLGNKLTVDTVATTLILADLHSHAELKNKCLDFVSNPENFSVAALTEGYFNIKQGAPSLFSELSEKIKESSRSVNKFAKKPRTS